MTKQYVVGPEETLGRGVFSSKYLGRLRRGIIHYSVYLETQGNDRISVDRLDKSSKLEATEIADDVAAKRGRKFYGWAEVKARYAATDGRQVVASPVPSNLYHADIVLPCITLTDRDTQIRHAHLLADLSSWRERDSETPNT